MLQGLDTILAPISYSFHLIFIIALGGDSNFHSQSDIVKTDSQKVCVIDPKLCSQYRSGHRFEFSSTWFSAF